MFCCKEAFKSTIIFKKILLGYFIFRTIFKLGKIKGINDFVRLYFNFFKRPLIFIFFFSFLDKRMRCYYRSNKLKSKLLLYFHMVFMNIAILVEDNKRIKELCNFLIVETTQTLVNVFKKTKNIKNEKFDEKFNVN